MSNVNNPGYKPVSKGQRTFWVAVALSILALMPFATSILLRSFIAPDHLHLTPYLAGTISFWMTVILLAKAQNIWKRKRIFDLRGFGPNYWLATGWALVLCWLTWLLYAAKALPDDTTILGAFTSFILESLFSGSFSLGMVLLMLLIFDEKYPDIVNSLCTALQNAGLHTHEITQDIIKNLKEEPYNIPDDAQILDSSWDTKDQKFILAMGWERKIEPDPVQHSPSSAKDKIPENKTMVHEIRVWTNPQGDIVQTTKKKTIEK